MCIIKEKTGNITESDATIVLTNMEYICQQGFCPSRDLQASKVGKQGFTTCIYIFLKKKKSTLAVSKNIFVLLVGMIHSLWKTELKVSDLKRRKFAEICESLDIRGKAEKIEENRGSDLTFLSVFSQDGNRKLAIFCLRIRTFLGFQFCLKQIFRICLHTF